MALRQHTTQFFLWQIRLSSEATPFQLRDKSAFPPSSAFSTLWKIRFFSKTTPFQLCEKSAFSPKQRLFNSVANPLFLRSNAFSTLWKMRLFLQTAYFRFYNKFVFALRKRTLRTKEEHEEKTFEQAYAPRGCCLFVKIRDIVFSRTCAGKRHLKSRERGDERGG